MMTTDDIEMELRVIAHNFNITRLIELAHNLRRIRTPMTIKVKIRPWHRRRLQLQRYADRQLGRELERIRLAPLAPHYAKVATGLDFGVPYRKVRSRG